MRFVNKKEIIKLRDVCNLLLNDFEDEEFYNEYAQAVFERTLKNGEDVQVQIVITKHKGDFLELIEDIEQLDSEILQFGEK